MLFIGIALPVPIGIWLIRSRRADLLLSLLGLASLPLIVWGASLGAKIGPCKVDGCMSSTQHSRLVFGIVALVILLAAFGLLAYRRVTAGGAVLVVAELVGAYSMTKTDTAAVITLVVFALAAGGYLVASFLSDRQAKQVPDFPPV